MRRRMKLLATAAAAIGTYGRIVRPRLLRWGATDDEATALLHGDALIHDPDLRATRAITIDAGPEDVWPWLVQLGQEKGGFYSYERLENLLGCDICNADRIVPEWQDVRVGDAVHLAPDFALHVAIIDPPNALVLHGGVPIGDAAPPFDFVWAFVLRGRPDGTTRLIVRESYAYTERWAPLVVEPVELVSFAMHRKMLRGIRDRAEPARSAAPSSTTIAHSA